MYAGVEFDDMDPTETDTFTIDFVRDLLVGETISSEAFVMEVVSGTDSRPNEKLVGGAFVSGTQVTQVISNPVPDVYYRLTAQITTSMARVLDLWSHFWCRTPY